jgi:magnesium-transporting ATPase (P-type)
MVRNPRTIEALGRVGVLCFDKTSTPPEAWLSLSQVDDGTPGLDVSALDD